jgi:hypothetical protein
LEAALKGVFNRVLTTLDLGMNDIGDEGAKAIAEALKVTAVLKNLRKASTRIGVSLCSRKMLAMWLPDIAVSHCSFSCQK